jgi:ribonuclease-3
MATAVQKLSRRLKVKREGMDLLRQALTHKSFLGEGGGLACNERLEFLGDSVLGLIVSEHLFSRFTESQEGELAKAKAVAVSEPILAEAARKSGIAEALFISPGEESSGGRNRPSILSDTFEAVVAAVYIINGFESARDFVLKSLRHILQDIESDEHHRNYKSLFQELSQSIYKKAPRYLVVNETGAAHDRTFVIEALLGGETLGVGEGKSKKQAEQAAAFEALRHPMFAQHKPGK